MNWYALIEAVLLIGTCFWIGSIVGRGMLLRSTIQKSLHQAEVYDPSPPPSVAVDRLLRLNTELHNKMTDMIIERRDLNISSLRVMRAVNNLFVQAHKDVAQRNARIQIVIRDAMQALLTGKPVTDKAEMRQGEIKNLELDAWLKNEFGVYISSDGRMPLDAAKTICCRAVKEFT